LTKGFEQPRFLGWRRCESDKEIEIFETTAGQVTDALIRHGVPKERMITVMIEPGDLADQSATGIAASGDRPLL
jgi:hypothetical protein